MLKIEEIFQVISINISFRVNCGVRQGGKLSPFAFNCFINLMITKLKSNNIGCSIGSIYLGCFFYADDIILLSASVRSSSEYA